MGSWLRACLDCRIGRCERGRWTSCEVLSAFDQQKTESFLKSPFSGKQLDRRSDRTAPANGVVNGSDCSGIQDLVGSLNPSLPGSPPQKGWQGWGPSPAEVGPRAMPTGGSQLRVPEPPLPRAARGGGAGKVWALAARLAGSMLALLTTPPKRSCSQVITPGSRAARPS